MNRFWARASGALVAFFGISGGALAHFGSLRASSAELVVPTWLFLMTGGAVIGASFLLASFFTDRALVDSIHARMWGFPAPRRTLGLIGRLTGIGGFVLVIWAGFFGPTGPNAALKNAAVLLVWVGWWAGFTITVYLFGNSWPSVDPFRTLTRPLTIVVPADRGIDNSLLPVEKLNENHVAWVSTAFFLVLVWIEVISPIADVPQLLAATVLCYLAIAAIGVLSVGHQTWFEQFDPISRLYRMYGSVAPIQRTDSGLRLRLPGARLTDDFVSNDGTLAFIVALLWGTTFDGLIGTPLWSSVASTLIETRIELPALFAGAPTPVIYPGIPPEILYPLTLLAGFGVFYWLFREAAIFTRRTAPTYTDTKTLVHRFAPTLLPIAAGYHLAHYLLYFLTLTPTLFGVLLSPANPPVARTLVLPTWVSGFGVAAVLLGHVLAIWAVHGVAFDEFPGRLQAVRSQYPITIVMVFYTMVSLWIVSQPFVQPPYL